MSVDLINKQMIAKSFGKAAHTYDSVAHFQRWVGETLLSRMPDNMINGKAKRILDLGCGTGHFFPALQSKYPGSKLFGLDLSEQMVAYSQKQFPNMDLSFLVGDGEAIPLQSGSVDIVFSNLSIQWSGNLEVLFGEINRVLSPQGICVFSSLLNGSLKELEDAWAEVDDTQHVNKLAEKHELVHAIEASGMAIQLLETQLKTLQYKSVKGLTKELKKLGAHNMTPGRTKHITGRQRVKQFMVAYQDFCLPNGCLPATYHVIWGYMSKCRDELKPTIGAQ